MMAAYGMDPRLPTPAHLAAGDEDSATGSMTASSARLLALVNGASLGEVTRTPMGNEPTTPALVRTAVRMRDRLDDPDTASHEQQHGPLPSSAAGRMVALGSSPSRLG